MLPPWPVLEGHHAAVLVTSEAEHAWERKACTICFLYAARDETVEHRIAVAEPLSAAV